MPYTMEQFRKDYVKAHLGDLDPEDRLKGLRAEEILRALKIEEVDVYLNKLKKKKRH